MFKMYYMFKIGPLKHGHVGLVDVLRSMRFKYLMLRRGAIKTSHLNSNG
jgi:hypothetical protein